MKCIGPIDSLDAIKRRITKYQTEIMFHPLTCGNDSLHQDLVPEIKDNQLVLVCLDCDYVQEYIPEFFLYKWEGEE